MHKKLLGLREQDLPMKVEHETTLDRNEMSMLRQIFLFNLKGNKTCGVESCLPSIGSQVADSDTAVSDGQLRNKRTPSDE